MIDTNHIKGLYFLGIGGIGMSALARYFYANGMQVAGYDLHRSPLTMALEDEGIVVNYEDAVTALPQWATDSATCLIVRTPAVPESTALTAFFRNNGYTIRKRAEVLGMVTREKKALCVAGTHGKTTTSTILAHLLRQSHIGTNAFLGGISNNYQTNLLLDDKSNFVVVEADEFDRSFHHLSPYMSVITAVDPDHLDIYGTEESYRESFEHYTSLIQSVLLVKQGVKLTPRLAAGARQFTYGVIETPRSNDLPDFYADAIRVAEGQIDFDFHTPTCVMRNMRLGVPVWVNIENSVAAMAIAWLNGVKEEELRVGLASFSGVYRRFNVHINKTSIAYVDDYAHHPTEIATSIHSIRCLFPERHLIGIFQPHLYTRTRDFANGFAQVLAELDEVVLLPIYPARELPIEGVDSEMLCRKIQNLGQMNVCIVEKQHLCQYLVDRVKATAEPTAVISLGAGDIDRLVPSIAEALNQN